jgi:hypothetical protein
MIDFINIFSRTNVLAKTDNTRNEVDTGTPILVSNTRIAGAAA